LIAVLVYIISDFFDPVRDDDTCDILSTTLISNDCAFYECVITFGFTQIHKSSTFVLPPIVLVHHHFRPN